MGKLQNTNLSFLRVSLLLSTCTPLSKKSLSNDYWASLTERQRNWRNSPEPDSSSKEIRASSDSDCRARSPWNLPITSQAWADSRSVTKEKQLLWESSRKLSNEMNTDRKMFFSRAILVKKISF